MKAKIFNILFIIFFIHALHCANTYSQDISWQRIIDANLPVTSVAVSPTKGLLFAHYTGYLTYSSDYGATWINLKGLSDVIRPVVFNHEGDIFCGMKWNGIARSTDLGATWNDISPIKNILSVNSIVFDSVGRTFVFTGGHGIFKSSDKGDHWVAIDTQYLFTYGSLMINKRDEIFASNKNNIFRSTDYGNTWEYVSSLSSDRIGKIFSFDEKDILIGTYDGKLFRSNNNGLTWMNVYAEPHNTSINDIAIDNVGRMYLATDSSGVLRSSDGGLTWIQMNDGLMSLCVTSLGVVDDYIFAGTPRGIHRAKYRNDFKTSIRCQLSAPTIKLAPSKDHYSPMPFVLTADVWNDGGVQSDSLYATIYLTPKLQLDTSENNQAIKVVVPAQLQPGQHGAVTWTLWHPQSADSVNYQVKVHVSEKNIDSSYCEIPINIPALTAANIVCNHICPDSLLWNDTLGQYYPNPFIITQWVKNLGGDDADSVHSTLILPPDLVLDPPTQNLTQYFNPMKVTPWNQNMPANKVTWTIRAIKIPKTRKCYTIQLVVNGVSSSGPTDPSFCTGYFCLPGVQPKITCDMNCPDSLYLDAAHTHLSPNPFTVRYVYKNIGWQPYGVREAQLLLENAQGVNIRKTDLNPVSINKIVPSHDSVDVKWRCEVINSLQNRVVRIHVIAIDEDGDPVENFRDVFIPAVDSLVEVKRYVESPTSFYLEQNYPNPFSLSTTINFNLTSPRRVFDPTLSLNKERKNDGQHHVTLKVFDVFGREVLDLSEQIDNSKLTIDNFQLPNAGIYFYRLTIGTQSQTRMMTLIN